MLNNKFFRSLFNGFLILFFAVFAFSLALTAFQELKAARTELQRNQETILTQWAGDTDNAIQYLSQVNQSFIATEECRQYMRGQQSPFDTYQAFQVYRKLYNRLEGLSLDAGGKIAVIPMGGRLALTPDGTCDVADYLGSIGYPDNILELYAHFSGSTGPLPQFWRIIRSDPQSSYITVVQKGRLDNQADYLTLLSLDKSHLFDSVAGLETAGMAILLNGDILAASETLDTEKLASFLAETPTEDNLLQKSYPYAGEIYTFRACRSLPLIYVYAGNRENSAVFSAGFFGMMLAFLLLGTGGCYLLSRFLYRPVMRLLGKFGGGAVRGQDEFAFLEDVSSRMRADNRAMADTLDKTRDLVRSEALRGLLYGAHTGAELTERLSPEDAAWLGGPTAVTIFRQAGENEEKVDWQQLALDIRQSFDGASPKIPCAFVPLEPGICAMVAGSRNTDWMKEQLISILADFQSQSGTYLTAVIGTPARFPDELRKAFSSAQYVAEYQRLLGQGRYVLTPEDISFRDENYYYPLRLEHDLISFTAQGMEQEAYQALEEIFEENFQHRTLPPDKLSLLSFAMAATVSRILEILGRSSEVFGENAVIYLELKMCKDPESLRGKILELFGVLLQEASGASRKQEYAMGSQLIVYVRENYRRDISLTDLSERFNMSQSYISTLFKNLAGTNFKEFLSRLRFEKALDLLEENPYAQTKDLAAQVGLNTPKALIALFNKYTGMSPKQYVATHLSL